MMISRQWLLEKSSCALVSHHCALSHLQHVAAKQCTVDKPQASRQLRGAENDSAGELTEPTPSCETV